MGAAMKRMTYVYWRSVRAVLGYGVTGFLSEAGPTNTVTPKHVVAIKKRIRGAGTVWKILL